MGKEIKSCIWFSCSNREDMAYHVDIYDVHHIDMQVDFPFTKENTLFHMAEQIDTFQGFIAMGKNHHE